MIKLIKKLYPICRSLTGKGNRETLEIIKKEIPIKLKSFKSGHPLYDQWIIPLEWNIKNAFIKERTGKKVLDFKKSNLHVVGYSTPIKKTITLQKLKKHIYTSKENPDAIPYRTSYYKRRWGFCMAYNQFIKLKKKTYNILIESSLKKGVMDYGELFIKGRKEEEILLSTYICHPSLCEDNLSGIALLTELTKGLLKNMPEYSYRILFIPETIGMIAWLHKNQYNNVKWGLAISCVGSNYPLIYKKTKQGDTEMDVAAEHIMMSHYVDPHLRIQKFCPSGSDERQLSTGGINIPCGSFRRFKEGYFKEYHSSDDNIDIISEEALDESLDAYKELLFILENNRRYHCVHQCCEPFLADRGIYSDIGGERKRTETENAIRWLLFLSDGKNSLLDIANKAEMKFKFIFDVAKMLEQKELIV